MEITWALLGVVALIIGIGAISDLSQPKPKPKRMSQRVNDFPLERDTFVNEFIFEHLMEGKVKYTDKTVHPFIRSHEKYKAKLLSFAVIGPKRVYMYKFADGSLLEIVNDPAITMLSYTPKKSES